MSNNDSLSPKCWGPTAWHFLHSVAMGYPEINTDANIALQYKTFFQSLEFVLPCEWCKIHYKNNLTTLPIDSYLDSRKNLALWVYKFHNLVNGATNVSPSSVPTFDEVYAKYDKFRAPCDNESKTCGGKSDDICNITIKNSTDKFMYSNSVFVTYWPLLVLIVILLCSLGVICLKNNVKK